MILWGGLGFLVLTYPKFWEFMFMLGLRGEGLRVWLFVDELSIRLDVINLPLFLLDRF